MRYLILPILCIVFISSLLEARTWTNREGQTMEADYSGTQEAGGKVFVLFVKSDGVRYQFPLTELSEDDQLYISSGKAATETPVPVVVNKRAKTSFENEIARNLVRSDGRRLSRIRSDEIDPKEFYVIYYSASWCPPCRAFTPKLVDFYKQQQKENGDNFEIIFVSSDNDEDAMTKYMRDYAMSWPALDYSKIKASRALNRYSGRGIPCLVLVDKNGEVISHSYEGDRYVGPNKVLRDLEAKLKADSL